MIATIILLTVGFIWVGVMFDLFIMRIISRGRHMIRIREGIEEEFLDIEITESGEDLQGIFERELAKERQYNNCLPSERRVLLSDFDLMVKARWNLVNKYHKKPRGAGYITLNLYDPEGNEQDPRKVNYGP